MKALRLIVRILAPLLVVAAGVGLVGFMVSTRPDAAGDPPQEEAVPVEVLELQPTRHAVVVRGQGTVTASRQVVVSPEVSGRVTWLNPELERGGRVAEGDVLLRIDRRDYTLAVTQARSVVQQAEVAVETERSLKHVAEKEWDYIDHGVDAENPAGRALALREPQLAAALAQLDAAKAQLQQAELALGRTTLRAPFNASVIAEQVEIGQLVSPGFAAVTLVGTDRYWVEVSLPSEKLRWFSVPGEGDAEAGAAVRVWPAGAQDDAALGRSGTVTRLLRDVDPVGRMAQVLIALDGPLDDSGAPLLLGAFVEVAIEGRALENSYEVPRAALREGDQLWFANGDSRLEMREVSIAWRDQDFVLVTEGLNPGSRLITSTIPAPIEGTALAVTSSQRAGATAEGQH